MHVEQILFLSIASKYVFSLVPVYKDSMRNIDLIRENGHEVKFEVDATCLEESFGYGSIDRIQWNFPHWRGKTNNRRNR